MFITTRKYLFSTAGSLFTWGEQTSALGYKVGVQTTSVTIPQQVPGFKNNVQQVVMGYNHSALVTDDGQLYTWGPVNYGSLGHNDNKDYSEPKLVEFFAKNNLKVKKIALGENHSVAITNDGDVWTWGWGGKEQNFLMNLLFLQVGALGHGDCKTRYTPTPVKCLRDFSPVKEVQCGLRFTNVINENNEMYVWGKGDYGVFGDGNNKSLNSPSRNDYFETYLKQQLNLSVVKLKSCNNYSMALMSDGQLYGWGSNDHGQMGIKNEIGVEIYETANFPTMTIKDEFNGANIIDFAVGEDLIAILLDNNQVYWSGSKVEFTPKRFQLPTGIGKITHIGCCYRCVVVVTEEGDIYFRKKFVTHEHEDLTTGVMKTTSQKLFNSGSILEIGGSYRNRYALIKE